MSKNTQKRGTAKGGPSSVKSGYPTLAPGAVPMPDKATVLDWVKKDLGSAHYLLGLILQRHPEIIREVADSIYDKVLAKEGGAGIDHVTPGAAETGLD